MFCFIVSKQNNTEHELSFFILINTGNTNITVNSCHYYLHSNLGQNAPNLLSIHPVVVIFCFVNSILDFVF